MNKFTFIVEGDKNKLTPDQELENFWNEYHGDKRATEIDSFEFYHKARDRGFVGEIIKNFLNKK